MANLRTYTAEEVLNKVIYNNTSLTTYSMDEGLNAVLDAGNDRLKLNLEGGTINGNVTITGELTVEGATTTIESTTVQVADKTFELAVTDTPTDATSDGGGIILKGTTDKTILWNDANDWWNFNQGVNITGDLNASGTVTADGLTVDGDLVTIQSDSGSSIPTLVIKDTDTGLISGQNMARIDFEQSDTDDPGVSARIQFDSDFNNGIAGLQLWSGSPTSLTKAFELDNNGDISFYEDTGTTAKFFWDGS